MGKTDKPIKVTIEVLEMVNDICEAEEVSASDICSPILMEHLQQRYMEAAKILANRYQKKLENLSKKTGKKDRSG